MTASGWRVLRFSGREINGRIEECARTIRRTVEQLGGLAPASRAPRRGRKSGKNAR
jgi:hypothetical protein